MAEQDLLMELAEAGRRQEVVQAVLGILVSSCLKSPRTVIALILGRRDT